MVTMVELQSCSLALHCVTTCILQSKIGQKFSCMTINFNLQAHGQLKQVFFLPTNFVFLSLSVQGAAPACRALRPLESPRSVPTFISRFASMALPFKFRRIDKYKYTKNAKFRFSDFIFRPTPSPPQVMASFMNSPLLITILTRSKN